MSDPVTVYLAARVEDREVMLALRGALAMYGIRCTAQWLDLADLTALTDDQAQMCLRDIRVAEVFVLFKPSASHRFTTGGHHVETGYALAMRKPLVLWGDRENVFHAHAAVQHVTPGAHVSELAHRIRQAASYGTPLPARVMEDAV